MHFQYQDDQMYSNNQILDLEVESYIDRYEDLRIISIIDNETGKELNPDELPENVFRVLVDRCTSTLYNSI